jgi:hypothetical protein
LGSPGQAFTYLGRQSAAEYDSIEPTREGNVSIVLLVSMTELAEPEDGSRAKVMTSMASVSITAIKLVLTFSNRPFDILISME